MSNKADGASTEAWVYPSSAIIHRPSRQQPTPDGAPAKARNLMGFLDAFKAVRRTDAPSLTHCEDFA
jgi:hypothetical protein